MHARTERILWRIRSARIYVGLFVLQAHTRTHWQAGHPKRPHKHAHQQHRTARLPLKMRDMYSMRNMSVYVYMFSCINRVAYMRVTRRQWQTTSGTKDAHTSTFTYIQLLTCTHTNTHTRARSLTLNGLGIIFSTHAFLFVHTNTREWAIFCFSECDCCLACSPHSGMHDHPPCNMLRCPAAICSHAHSHTHAHSQTRSPTHGT